MPRDLTVDVVWELVCRVGGTALVAVSVDSRPPTLCLIETEEIDDEDESE